VLHGECFPIAFFASPSVVFEGNTHPENETGMKLLPESSDSPESSIRMGFLPFHLGALVCLQTPAEVFDIPGSLDTVMGDHSPALRLQVVQGGGCLGGCC